MRALFRAHAQPNHEPIIMHYGCVHHDRWSGRDVNSIPAAVCGMRRSSTAHVDREVVLQGPRSGVEDGVRKLCHATDAARPYAARGQRRRHRCSVLLAWVKLRGVAGNAA